MLPKRDLNQDKEKTPLGVAAGGRRQDAVPKRGGPMWTRVWAKGTENKRPASHPRIGVGGVGCVVIWAVSGVGVGVGIAVSACGWCALCRCEL